MSKQLHPGLRGMNKEGTLPWPQLRFRSLWRSPGCPRQGKAASGGENWQTWAGAGGYGLQLAQEGCWGKGLPPCQASAGGAKLSSLVSNGSSTLVAARLKHQSRALVPTPHVSWQRLPWFYTDCVVPRTVHRPCSPSHSKPRFPVTRAVLLSCTALALWSSHWKASPYHLTGPVSLKCWMQFSVQKTFFPPASFRNI